MVPEQFATRQLRAERFDDAHFAELRLFHQDDLMMAMIGGVRDEPGTRAYLQRHIMHWHEHRFGFWFLRDRFTNAAAGLAGLRRLTLDGVDEVELGYGLLPAFWGRGLATEIALACAGHAYDAVGATTIVALAHHDNGASHRVLRKVGLAYERDITLDERTSMLFRGVKPDAPR